jgi:peptide deformylase
VSVLPLRLMGDPVLRRETAVLSSADLSTPATQRFIDDLIETKRAANGAGLAANQVGDTRRIAVVEVEDGNPRYPYKPAYPLTVLVNPRIVSRSDEEIEINEGCLSVPDLRGTVARSAEIVVEYEDRDGATQRRAVAGLSAGTFQHEIDHLDGLLFVDRADPRTLATWEMFERHQREAFEAHARAIVERFGS